MNPTPQDPDGSPDPIRAARSEVEQSSVAPADATTSAEQPGERIGRYKLLQLIGEGGFGTVWMAEQTEPVRRKVALKIIKLGMDTKQVIARFDAERQALALMDYPHIAKVFDGGATETGRPFFVMELVKGLPITEFCDGAKLGIRERLDLFVQVCGAIQHAHQKGVIHRDIKPSNVLVTLHDGVPVPKVIDFGIAKATSAELTQKTLFTEFRQMIGTPEYMAPEQAEMSGLDIDTRADVYSLGVLLYELLTGTKPFDLREALARSYDELLRTIREEEPVKPSTRVSTLDDAGSSVAERRHVDVEKLSGLLRGDLDWIVLKALEKDRARRYEAASAFADDVRRHLEDEPVLASPPSHLYRLSKLVRRNRTAAIAVGAVSLSLLTATVVSVGFAWSEARQRRLADQAALQEKNARKEEQQQREVAQSKTAEAEAARADAEASRNAARRDSYSAHFAVAALLLQNHEPGPARIRLERAPEEHRGWEWHRLRLESDASLAFLSGHEGRVLTAAFSPDGTRIASGGEDGTVRLWDPATGTQLAVLRGHEGWVVTLAFSPDGKRLVTGGGSLRESTKQLWLWDVEAHRAIAELSGHKSIVLSVAFNHDGSRIASGSRDEEGSHLRLWDGRTGAPLPLPSNPAKRVSRVAFDPTGLMLASGGLGGPVDLRDGETGELRMVLGNGERLGLRFVFSPDGHRLFASSALMEQQGTIELWDTTTGEILASHDGGWLDAAYSPNGSRIAIARSDGLVRVWDKDLVEPLHTLLGHEGRVTAIAFSPDGNLLASGAGGIYEPAFGSWHTGQGDNTIRLWDPESGALVTILLGHEGGVESLAFSPDGDRLLSASDDGTLRLWNARTPRTVARLDGGSPMAFSPDGALLVCGYEGDALALWDVEEGEHIATLRGHVDQPSTLAFSPDGKLLATGAYDMMGSRDYTARLWDVDARVPRATLRGHEDGVSAVAFSPDGTLIATGAGDGVRLWDAATGAPLHTLLTSEGDAPGGVWEIEFDATGKRILARQWNGSVHVWDASTGASAYSLEGHRSESESAVAFSPDGRRIATGSPDGGLRIWDALTGALLTEEPITGGNVDLLSYSPDGSQIATSLSGGSIRLWDGASGKPIGHHVGHQARVTALTFSPDGRRMASVAHDKTLRLWNVEDGELLARGTGGLPYGILFSPDGTCIATDGSGVQLWPTRSADLQRYQENEARRQRIEPLVSNLFDEGLLLEEVVKRIGRADVDEDTRTRAVRLADALGDDPTRLDDFAWQVIRDGSASTVRVARAAELARRAHELTPDHPRYAATLGGALVRLEQWEEAIEKLEQVLATLDAGRGPNTFGGWPEALQIRCLAFLVIARTALGQTQEARILFEQIQALCADTDDQEMLRMLREAEERLRR